MRLDTRPTEQAAAGPRPAEPSPPPRWSRLAHPGPIDLILVLIVVLAGLYVSDQVGAVHEWRVMTDELLYQKLGIGFSEGLNPTVHGQPSNVRNVLFSLLIAPIYAFQSVPDAFQTTLTLNSWLMASTAIPVFLITRSVTGRRGPAYMVAAMAVLVPWMTQSTNTMTESTAYPVFLWAVYGMHRAIVRRGPSADLLALGLIALAYLARTQFVVLAPILPVAILIHELSVAISEDDSRFRLGAIRAGLASAVRGHVVLLSVLALGFAYAVVGSGAGLLGSYSTTTSGSFFPAGFVTQFWRHVNAIVVGVAIVPFTFTVAWVLGQVGRPRGRAAHAYAVLALLVIPALCLVVTSYDMRFSIGGFLQERYLFFIAPLYFIGFAAWFAAPRKPVAAMLAALGLTAWTVTRTDYGQDLIAGFASPQLAFYKVIDGRTYEIATKLGSTMEGRYVLAILVTIAAVGLMVAGRRFGGRAFIPVGALTVLFLFAQLNYVFPRVVADHNNPTANFFPGRPLEGRDWVDRTAGPDARVALIPGTINSRGGVPFFNQPLNDVEWWDVDFWNKTIRSVYSIEGATGGFATTPAEAKWDSGALQLPGEPPDHLVMAQGDVRFAPQADAASIVDQGDLTLYETRDPSKLAWMSRGIAHDGWTQTGEPALVRVFGDPERGALVWRLRIRMYAGGDVPGGRDYVLRFGNAKARGRVTTTADATATACIPPGGHVTGRLEPKGSTTFPDGRRVGVRVITIRAVPTGRHCQPSPPGS